jgi:multidrug resistance efflux pump
MNALIKIIKEDIIGTDNRWIAFSWLACIAGILGLGVYLSSESMSFLGIADSRELQVNFEYPVSVKRVLVLPGQRVEKGDLLIELDQSEIGTQIRTLEGQIARTEAELRLRHDLNKIVGNSEAAASADPLTVDLMDFKGQLAYLENQKKNLYIFADVSGLVGSVNYKKGEKVPAFTALITLTPENPSYVQGFIHENMRTKLTVNTPVTVKPLTSGASAVEGKIVSVGARMLPMPPRMLHNATIPMYGREVIVELPEKNGFLIGERVQISTW